jgi:hypothetical protein
LFRSGQVGLESRGLGWLSAGLGLSPTLPLVSLGSKFFSTAILDEYFNFNCKMVSIQFTSPSIFQIARNTAVNMIDEILTAMKEPACPIPVFNQK